MDVKDKLIKGRIKLQKSQPFFSYLSMSLQLKEEPKVKTCAVDYKGNLYYAPEFIKTLTTEQIKTLLCHEVMHVALQHLSRVKSKDKLLWNIATDLVINNLLVNNGFSFAGEMRKGLVPENNSYSFGKELTIKNLHEKMAEQVYNELNASKLGNKIKGMYVSFDTHLYGQDDIEISEEEAKAISEIWKKNFVEAQTFAQMQGKLPSNTGLMIDNILEAKLNWREILYKYITQSIPFDYTYSYPSKKSQVLGIYMPKLKRDVIDVAVAVDVSGSVGKEQLTEFMSELVAISQSFDSIRLNVLFWDTGIKNHYVLNNGNTDEVLGYEISGGGGTDFTSIYTYMQDNITNVQLLIFLTDGFATFPQHEEIKTLWVLCKNHTDEKSIPFGEVMVLE